ncbi:uncharacterized protein FOBCDRAFT_253608 [Fusarium oxysporum Fo47]|nr:uncharacterized protein FOBCDRAFT_253608 [Fusarium oxysporum Fo47]QKD60828.2 hypothetical protein FOBCDRAFT_253608 [Fusarium oxysporum Fo47]
MATLNALKKALKKVSDEAPRKPLNDEEYDDGLSLFSQASGEQTYQKTFIIPQLSELIASLSARDEISVVEIGPGPENVLGHLPAILRKRITKYVALEPSFQYTQSLTRWLSPMEDERPLPSLKHLLVRPTPFTPESCKGQNYDDILFCHSLCGMKREEKSIRHTLTMLSKDPLGGMPSKTTMKPSTVSLASSPDTVQSCVRLALANKTSLAILGGGHSDHCLWPNVVSVEMGAFDKVYVVNTPQNADTDCWVVAEAGCVTVTLGSRPSVGAGFWLQGGIGHLARHYGLACDAIVGAVMVDAISGQVLCIGHVPEHNIDHRMLFATNMMRNYLRNYGQPNDHNAEETLANASRDVSSQYPHGISSDYEGGQMRCGMTTFLCSLKGVSHDSSKGLLLETVDAIELFDKEMYISKMHGGHGGGKTSAFKRCVFLKDMANTGAIKVLIPATKDDWDLACVFTGVWPREYDGTRISNAVIHWVYRVVNELLPMSKGVYGADLGPDPRDIHGYSSRVVSISKVTKRKYAAETGADPDRPYKEQHRKSINVFYKNQLKTDSFVAENHFLEMLKENASDVLFITGLTEMASVATLSHLIHDARLIDVRNLAGMVSTAPNFPGKDIDFRYVLNIAQQKGGLALCTSLLKSHFSGDWKKVDAVVTSETSGYVLASPLAMQIEIPLVLIVKGNKFPPPTVSVQRRMSHISSRILNASDKGRFEVDANVVSKGDSVVIVDDVLATGETLVAVLELLVKVGLQPEDISVMVAAEFPFHRGREKLWAHGFRRVAVQSLLVLDGQ